MNECDCINVNKWSEISETYLPKQSYSIKIASIHAIGNSSLCIKQSVWFPTYGNSIYTLRKFRRYNKASLGELVLLEILSKHQQGLPRGVCSTCLIFLVKCARV